MRNMSSRFAKVRSNIRKGRGDEAIDLLNALQEDIISHMDAHLRVIEEANKKPCPMEDRFLQVVPAEGSTHRFTVNAHTGRFTLKLNNIATEIVRSELILFAKKCMKEEFPAVTMRGKIRWLFGAYRCHMENPSGRFQKSIELTPEELLE